VKETLYNTGISVALSETIVPVPKRTKTK
jgi:hypothetical protein